MPGLLDRSSVPHGLGQRRNSASRAAWSMGTRTSAGRGHVLLRVTARPAEAQQVASRQDRGSQEPDDELKAAYEALNRGSVENLDPVGWRRLRR